MATAILTTGDYLLHLADVAREMGLDPKRDFKTVKKRAMWGLLRAFQEGRLDQPPKPTPFGQD